MPKKDAILSLAKDGEREVGRHKRGGRGYGEGRSQDAVQPAPPNIADAGSVGRWAGGVIQNS